MAAGPSRIVLLAARERGYRSLMRLNSRAFLETPVHQAPHIKFEWLDGDAEDLIALTGGPTDRSRWRLPPITGHSHRRAATGWQACSVTAFTSNYNATASRRNAASRLD